MVVGMPLPAVDTDCMLAEAGVPEAAELPVGEVESAVEAAAVAASADFRSHNSRTKPIAPVEVEEGLPEYLEAPWAIAGCMPLLQAVLAQLWTLQPSMRNSLAAHPEQEEGLVAVVVGVGCTMMVQPRRDFCS